MGVINLTNKDFKDVVNKEGITVVDFWAPWCGPCKAFSPVIEEVANEIDDVKICKVNVDDERMLAMKNRVMSIPTVLIYKDGKQISRNQGALPKEEFIELINNAR